MSAEEREALRAKNAEYQRKYRRENPAKVAVWMARAYLRKLERYGMELKSDEQSE
jgi:hypothetical protein